MFIPSDSLQTIITAEMMSIEGKGWCLQLNVLRAGQACLYEEMVFWHAE